MKTKIGVIVSILVAVVVLGTTAYAASAAKGGTRPGWGYGDKNHVHTGPPGQSVRAKH